MTAWNNSIDWLIEVLNRSAICPETDVRVSVFILGLSGGKSPPPKKKMSEIPPKKIKMNYAKIEFLSISGVIFSPASGGFAPRPHWGSTPGPDLPLLFKLHDIWLVDSQENH